jgi:hypothetical protein
VNKSLTRPCHREEGTIKTVLKEICIPDVILSLWVCQLPSAALLAGCTTAQDRTYGACDPERITVIFQGWIVGVCFRRSYNKAANEVNFHRCRKYVIRFVVKRQTESINVWC